jgi:glutamyl-tRNA reductase
MNIFGIGINHKTAPVEIRGKVAFQPEQFITALRELQSFAQLQEVALISTCNRTEIYAIGENLNTATIINWLENYHNLEQNSLSSHLYEHKDVAAIEHLMAVACGLDSMVLGEPQILGQLKQSHNLAKQAGTLDTRLDRLFQTTFSMAKRVRTETDIGASAVSVAFAAVSLCKQLFVDFNNLSALFVGAGDTIELSMRHLHAQGVKKMVVANRTRERARIIADEYQATTIALDEIPQYLAQADILISSTGSPLPIIGKGMVEKALKMRKRKPIFMVDLAVPRDIEAEVSDLSDIYLYTVDDLEGVIETNLKARESAKKDVQQIIDESSLQYQQWHQSLSGVDVIKQFRNRLEAMRDEELERALNSLNEEAEIEKIMGELAYRLTNKFLHHPTRYLHQAASSGDQEKAEHVQKIFELNKDKKK